MPLSSHAVARLKVIAVVIALAAGVALASPADQTSPGHLRFRGHVSLGDVDGEFRDWRITRAAIDDAHPERSEVEVEVDVASLDTANVTRDRHLRSESFLDVAHYRTAVARVRDVRIETATSFSASVELDLHGHVGTLPMRFSILDRDARRIAGTVTLRRSDFGVGSARGGIFQVADEVQVSVDAVVPTPLAAGGGE